MKKQTLFALLVLGTLVLLAGAPAHAQDMGKISLFGGYSYQVNNLGINSCLLTDFCNNVHIGMHGYAAAGSYNFTKNIGLEASFDGHNGGAAIVTIAPSSTNNGIQEHQTQDIYTYTFGPKVSLPVGNFSLFSHFLVGGIHAHTGDIESCIPATGGSSTCSGSGFSTKGAGNGMAFKTGAGVDWNHGSWGIRILEVDYVHGTVTVTGNVSCSGCPPSESTATSANDFELSTGVIFHFK